ncbi:hypothetical protein F4777DRAFT_13522 [Nemania sp. FL0916]|nr:hypothetical protein F4777DRAFT_13522 [Nemania sp. FL0916]
MKFSNALVGVAVFVHGISAAATPDPNADVVALDARTPESDFETYVERSANEELWKRKGGGGGGSRGGGGGSSSSGGKGGSSSSSGGGGSSRPAPGSSSSNAGGRTTTGSGARPMYGSYYGGGATQPYGPRGTSPSGIAPVVLGTAAIAGVAFLGFAYLNANGAYAYPYRNPYTFYNVTTDRNETKPIQCLCDQYTTCGCDDNGDKTYLNDVIGNGSYAALNHSIVDVAKNDKGQDTIYINGILPNGTTASGGDTSPNAAGSMMALAQAAGWWPAATVAFALAFLL